MMWRGKAEPLSCLLLLFCFSPEGPRFLIGSHSSVTVAARVCARIFLQLPSQSVQPCPLSTPTHLAALGVNAYWRGTGCGGNLPVITQAGLSLESKVLESPGPPCAKIRELYMLCPLRELARPQRNFFELLSK